MVHHDWLCVVCLVNCHQLIEAANSLVVARLA